jgi:hypothetical protein
MRQTWPKFVFGDGWQAEQIALPATSTNQCKNALPSLPVLIAIFGCNGYLNLQLER